MTPYSTSAFVMTGRRALLFLIGGLDYAEMWKLALSRRLMIAPTDLYPFRLAPHGSGRDHEAQHAGALARPESLRMLIP